MSVDRKAATREYRDTPREAGVYSITNRSTGVVFLGSSVDVPSMLNRARFQLEMGSWPAREVQADWESMGPDVFEFAVTDLIDRSDDPARDVTEDVAELEAMWRERLTAEGVTLYPAAPGRRRVR